MYRMSVRALSKSEIVENVKNTELVTNGVFADTSGWSPVNSQLSIDSLGGKITGVFNQLLPNGRNFDDPKWQRLGVGVASTKFISPYGEVTAAKIFTNASLDSYLFQDHTLITSVGAVFTLSVYLWTDVGQDTSLDLFLYDPESSFASSVTPTNVTITTEPQLYTLTVTAPEGTDSDQDFENYVISNPDSGDYFYIWGAKLEAGGTATPLKTTAFIYQTVTLKAGVTYQIKSKITTGTAANHQLSLHNSTPTDLALNIVAGGPGQSSFRYTAEAGETYYIACGNINENLSGLTNTFDNISIRQIENISVVAGDWTFGNGLADYIQEEAEINQDLSTRLKSFKNDNPLNMDDNIDWIGLLGRKGTEDTILKEIERVALQTEGITRITSLEVTKTVDRVQSISLLYNTIYTENEELEITDL